jgi:transcriptional regulator with XRE-family HTH domain
MKVNPHMDNGLRDTFSMAKAREIAARNVRDRMQAGPLKTQTLLAKKAKIGQSHVSRILNAASGVTIDRLELVAAALGCEPYELLLDDEQARRALIERLMRSPAVPDSRVEQAGFVPMPNHDDGEPDPIDDLMRREPVKRYGEGPPPGRLKLTKATGKKK